MRYSKEDIRKWYEQHGLEVEVLNGDEMTPEKEQEIIERGLPVIITDRWYSKFMLVYGTLRMGQGNYKWHLHGKSEYINTQRMIGFKKCSGLTSTWTGNAYDSTVMDLFEVHDKHFTSVNASIDSLEGCTSGSHINYYSIAAVPVMLPDGRKVLAKAYPIPDALTSPAAPSNDYIAHQVQNSPDNFEDFVSTTYPDTARNFINFYSINKTQVNHENEAEEKVNA